MRAIQVTHHGGPEVLNYGTVDDPIPAPDEVIARTSASGVNFIDTANTYAHGTNEEYIGEALRRLAVPREDVVLASKAYFNEGHLSRGRSSGRSRGP